MDDESEYIGLAVEPTIFDPKEAEELEGVALTRLDLDEVGEREIDLVEELVEISSTGIEPGVLRDRDIELVKELEEMAPLGFDPAALGDREMELVEDLEDRLVADATVDSTAEALLSVLGITTPLGVLEAAMLDAMPLEVTDGDTLGVVD